MKIALHGMGTGFLIGAAMFAIAKDYTQAVALGVVACGFFLALLALNPFKD